MKKQTKYSLIGLVLICFSAMMVSGAVFTYMWQGTVNGSAGYLMQYDQGSGWENAEDLTVDLSTVSLVAGETEFFTHDWRVNANLGTDKEVVVTFAYVSNAGSDDLTGIDLFVYFDDGVTNQTIMKIEDGVDTTDTMSGDDHFIVEGGDTGTVYVKIVADDHLEEGTYLWDYNVDVIVQDDGTGKP